MPDIFENPLNLDGLNIVITGVSAGIGRGIAILCSNLGANIIGISRNTEEMNNTLNFMAPGKHIMISHDLTDFNNLESVIKESVNEIGRISGFVHAAGIDETLSLKNMNIETYYKLFSVNVFAGFEIARILSKKKYLSKSGSKFVFIASVMGFLGKPGRVGYSATKGAVISGVKSMALELIKKNINVNSISPAMVATDMWSELSNTLSKNDIDSIMASHPSGIGKVDDVANAAVFLLSDMSNWITGTNLIVDGGYSSL